MSLYKVIKEIVVPWPLIETRGTETIIAEGVNFCKLIIPPSEELTRGVWRPQYSGEVVAYDWTKFEFVRLRIPINHLFIEIEVKTDFVERV